MLCDEKYSSSYLELIRVISVGRIQANAKDYEKDSPQKRRLGTRQENVLFIHG